MNQLKNEFILDRFVYVGWVSSFTEFSVIGEELVCDEKGCWCSIKNGIGIW